MARLVAGASLVAASGCAGGGAAPTAERTEPVPTAPIEGVDTTDPVETSPTTQPPREIPPVDEIDLVELGATDLAAIPA
jgi:hypothetical protein